VSDLDEIYDALLDSDPAALAARFQATPGAAQQQADAQLSTMSASGEITVRQEARLGFVHETASLVSRYARVFTRDRKSLTLLLAQAPLLGILAALMFPASVLSNANHTKDAANLIFLLITISIWMGAVSASREIVRERALLMREMALGVRLTSYLSSKMLIIGTLAIVQVTMMVTCALVIRHPSGSLGEILGVVTCLLLSGVVAVTLGLVISAYAKTENQANSLMPLALVPQLLLGGAIVAIAKMPIPVNLISPFIFSRWTFAGAGTAYHLQQRIEADPQFSRIQEYGFSFFDLSILELAAIMALFMAAQLGLAAYLLRRDELTGS
jgi:hypothetical protein